MDLVIQSLFDQFRKDRDLTGITDEEAFEAFAGFCVLSRFYEGQFDPDAYRVGGGNDLGIDAFGIVINGDLMRDEAEVQTAVEQSAKLLDVRIVIVQAKTSARFETKVVADLAENLRHVVGLGDVPYAISDEIQNLRKCLRIIYTNIAKLSGGLPRLHVAYVTTASQVAQMVAQKARSAERSLSSVGRFAEVDFGCVTWLELREMYQRATTAVGAQFTIARKVALPKVPNIEQSLLGLLPATELVAQILTDPGGGIRKTLFRENVRDFQGYNGVNEEIRKTLRDPVRRERFAVLNNGITIVTRELTVSGDELHIRDFQIVNGCQTCHVLFDQRDQLTDAVQVRVSIVHSTDEDIIGGIIAATNRQTAVSEEDLSAREEFHRILEEFFQAQPDARRLYYERRSKQYSTDAKVEKTRVITRAQIGRAYLAMFHNEPARVGRVREDTLFKTGQDPQIYYTAAATLYRLEWLIRNRRIPTAYNPARFHLLAAIKLRLLGPAALSQKPRIAAQQCEKILQRIWHPTQSEQLVLDVLGPLQRVIESERGSGVPISDMVRTQRFAELVRREVLGTTR